MLLRLITQWRRAKAEVLKDASELHTFLGDGAYGAARTRARLCRSEGDRAGARHWSRVAVLIAKRTGRTIGETAADRYAADRPSVGDQRKSEVAEGIVEIAQAIADLARGRGHATTLHNASAAVHRTAALARNPALARDAASDLLDVLRELADTPAESAAALASGMYPSSAQRAGEALQRFREACEG